MKSFFLYDLIIHTFKIRCVAEKIRIKAYGLNVFDEKKDSIAA